MRRLLSSYTVVWFILILFAGTLRDAMAYRDPDRRSLDDEDAFVSLHIDCGATTTHVDADTKKQWVPDTEGFLVDPDGSTVVVTLGAGEVVTTSTTTDAVPLIYQTLRQPSSSNANVSYVLDVPNGDYTMVFHLMDPRSEESGSSSRLDVWVQGRVVLPALDITQLAGGRRRPYLARRRVLVENGRLAAQLIPVQGFAAVAAIELVLRKRATAVPVPVPTAPPDPTPVPTAIPVASPVLPPTTTIATPLPVLVIGGRTPSSPPSLGPTSSPVPPLPIVPLLTSAPTALPTTATPSVAPTSPLPPPIAMTTTDPLPILPGGRAVDTTPSSSFEPLRINAGGRTYVNPIDGTVWLRDRYYVSGSVYARYAEISGTIDDELYATERFGTVRYEIPLPAAQQYEVILYFAEIHYTTPGARLFSVKIQDDLVFPSVDLFALGGGSHEITLEAPAVVGGDGILSLQLSRLDNGGNPKLNALEVVRVESHLAHAVTQGPYVAVDTDGDTKAVVALDGTLSHTHGYDLVLTDWQWTILDTDVRATGEVTSVELPVGQYQVTLLVTDSGGNTNAETTTIDVLPQGHPWISSIQPLRGVVTGGDMVTLSGFGLGNVVSLQFGDANLQSSEITIVSPTVLQFHSPLASAARPVNVHVETDVGTSNAVSFTYYDGSPIVFEKGIVAFIPSPTAVAFGPDHKLYVGTSRGLLFKLTVDRAWNVVESVSSSLIASLNDDRMILGIAFDPTDVFAENPAVFVSHSRPFHGSSQSSSRTTTNGKVSRVSGANLDVIEDVVTGLPVSDHDHAVNGIEFGDNGELYIQVAGATNSGVPGGLSSTKLLKDNIVSGATLVAHLGAEGFTGRLLYDATDDGNLLPGSGVEIFAYGLRNPYGITLHSNGKLYGTDNGPDINFGSRSVSCDGSELPGIEEDDKLLLLEKNHYYGQPNRKRGENDPRQCVWHSIKDPDQGFNYTAPLATNPSSIDGIVEFQTNHFGGQLRHNLIVAKYKKQLYRVILNTDGSAVLPQSNPLLPLTGEYSLDVTQAPDGSLIVAQYLAGRVSYYMPIEEMQDQLLVYGVFPRRGPLPTMPKITVYVSSSASLQNARVMVGLYVCPVIETIQNSAIVCGPVESTSGTSETVDVVVSLANGDTETLARGFRFITGKPVVEP